nr:hypothetical protein [Tanacetum cinerariifolium]GFA16800.1 hypothetical protein [Tanacetum cinerariifolium]
MSPIHSFLSKDMYSPQYLDSFQRTARDDSLVEIGAPPSKSKLTSNAKRGRLKTRMHLGPLHGQMRKKFHCVKIGFTYPNIASLAQANGAENENYNAMALLDYQAGHGMSFTLRHCWEFIQHRVWDASINLNVDVGDEDEDEV